MIRVMRGGRRGAARAPHFTASRAAMSTPAPITRSSLLPLKATTPTLPILFLPIYMLDYRRHDAFGHDSMGQSGGLEELLFDCWRVR